MLLSDITPVILTYNEEPNIARVLARLQWAAQVVILDSFSTDATEQIAAKYPNTRFVQRAFDDHTSQWNHAISLVTTTWILVLDADYVLGNGFVEELSTLKLVQGCNAYQASFRYVIFGRPLRGSLYPARIVLFQKGTAYFEQDGHTQLLVATGNVSSLQSKIDHDDRKPLSRWLNSQDKYAKLEAEKLVPLPSSQLALQDRVRRTMILGPIAALIYTLFVRGVIFDGLPGWYYTFQRVLAEILLSLRLLEKKLNASALQHSSQSPPNQV